MNEYEPHRSLFGLEARVAALLLYLAVGILNLSPDLRPLALLLPLLFFFMEKDSAFVRRHAVQAFSLGVSAALVRMLLQVLLNAAHAALVPMSWISAGLGVKLWTVAAAAGNVLIWVTQIGILALAVWGAAESGSGRSFQMPVAGEWFSRWMDPQ